MIPISQPPEELDACPQGRGCNQSPVVGMFSQVTEDPFSFPKAEGASAIVDLSIISRDESGKEKAEGRRASVWRHDQGAQGERGLASGACHAAKMEAKMMGRRASISRRRTTGRTGCMAA